MLQIFLLLLVLELTKQLLLLDAEVTWRVNHLTIAVKCLPEEFWTVIFSNEQAPLLILSPGLTLRFCAFLQAIEPVVLNNPHVDTMVIFVAVTSNLLEGHQKLEVIHFLTTFLKVTRRHVALEGRNGRLRAVPSV